MFYKVSGLFWTSTTQLYFNWIQNLCGMKDLFICVFFVWVSLILNFLRTWFELSKNLYKTWRFWFSSQQNPPGSRPQDSVDSKGAAQSDSKVMDLSGSANLSQDSQGFLLYKDIYIIYIYLEPQRTIDKRLFQLDDSKSLYTDLYIGNGWKSPNIHFKLVVWGSYIYICE